MKLFMVSLCFVLASYSVADAEVYKWVDENGNTHYSDSPPPKQQTEKVRIDKASTPAPNRVNYDSPGAGATETDTDEPKQVSDRATCSKAIRNLRRFAPAWERKIRAKMPGMPAEKRAETERNLTKMKQDLSELQSAMGQCVSEMNDPGNRRKAQCMAEATDDTEAMFCVM